MRRILTLAALIATQTLLASAQDFRVELFSRTPPQALTLCALTKSVNICRAQEPTRCLTFQSRESVRCERSKVGVRCASMAGQREARTLTASSTAPFRISPHFPDLGSQPPNLFVREMEVTSGPRGLGVRVNMSLESYVAGVLAGEAGILESSAGLEALAVVARTWAQKKRGRHQGEDFDFCSLTHCQVFHAPSKANGGFESMIENAVRNTQGKVLHFQDELADVYFGANCGGVTETASNIWPDRAQPYLVSVLDPYCRSSEHATWVRQLSLLSAENILRGQLGLLFRGSLRNLKVAMRNSSGRAQKLLLVTSNSSQRIDANAFRYAVNRKLGWNTIKSNLYDLEMHSDMLVLRGRGLGHAVGLCQAGAEQMGRAGFSYEKILATYFPGTTLTKTVEQSSRATLMSEHFELVFPPGQKPWVEEALSRLEILRRELNNRGLEAPMKVRVETWNTTPEFIRATSQPGWVAASSGGSTIVLQPLRLLVRKRILEKTLRHELAHLAVHPLRARGVPQWFEEGLVLHLTAEPVEASAASNPENRNLEEAVTRPRSEAEMRSAYLRALQRVRKVVQERGESGLWNIFRQPNEDDLRALSQ